MITQAVPDYMTFQYWYDLPVKRKKWPYKSLDDWVARNPGRAAGVAHFAPQVVRYYTSGTFGPGGTGDANWRPMGAQREITLAEYHELVETPLWERPAVMPVWRGATDLTPIRKNGKKSKPIKVKVAAVHQVTAARCQPAPMPPVKPTIEQRYANYCGACSMLEKPPEDMGVWMLRMAGMGVL
jgi:hypothetical protein